MSTKSENLNDAPRTRITLSLTQRCANQRCTPLLLFLVLFPALIAVVPPINRRCDPTLLFPLEDARARSRSPPKPPPADPRIHSPHRPYFCLFSGVLLGLKAFFWLPLPRVSSPQTVVTQFEFGPTRNQLLPISRDGTGVLNFKKALCLRAYTQRGDLGGLKFVCMEKSYDIYNISTIFLLQNHDNFLSLHKNNQIFLHIAP